MSRYLFFLIGLAGILFSLSSRADSPPLAPGYGALNYVLPEPGSYELPVLGKAKNGEVLDSSGETTTLYEIFQDRYVLLSFIYSSCSDINGCPLSSQVSYKLKSAMRHDPVLASKLKLVSLSFDPEYDTPEVMRLYGDNFKYAGDAGEWSFLTTDSIEKLNPLLLAYKQDIQRNYSVESNASRDYAHILRVFLIDPERNVRNIYSVEFLHNDIVLNDFKTLLLDEQVEHMESNLVATAAAQPSIHPLGAGDYKQGYESSSYATRSKALQRRTGEAIDLLGIAQFTPLGLPSLPESMFQKLSREKIQLGRKLFYDRRLSLNDTISCAMCHVPEQGFTSNEVSTAIGFEGRSVRRNSPTVLNVAHARLLFHDGREDKLEQQIWGPLLARNEMANPSIGYVINKIKSLQDYGKLFELAFDGDGPTMQTVGQALAAYQITLLSADSDFDRWYYSGDSNALDDDEQTGFHLFTGKARCSSCHIVGDEYALFTDQSMHNTGLGFEAALGGTGGKRKVILAPGISVEVDNKIINSVRQNSFSDVGLYEITQNPDDRWKYKTPTLRNIELTPPYMHDGSMSTLRDVVEFYNQGGIANELLDPLLQPLQLEPQEIDQLVAFLKTLNGRNLDELVLDAFAAPVGDTGHSVQQ